MDFNITSLYVKSPSDVIDNIGLIKSNYVLIMLPDLTVFNNQSFTALMNVSIKNKIQFIGYNEYFVKLGCLFALAPDLYAEASQVAGMLYELKKGKTPDEVGIQSCVGTKMIFNKKTAKVIGFDYTTIIGGMDRVLP